MRNKVIELFKAPKQEVDQGRLSWRVSIAAILLMSAACYGLGYVAFMAVWNLLGSGQP